LLLLLPLLLPPLVLSPPVPALSAVVTAASHVRSARATSPSSSSIFPDVLSCAPPRRDPAAAPLGEPLREPPRKGRPRLLRPRRVPALVLVLVLLLLFLLLFLLLLCCCCCCCCLLATL
jgi:hypothetical protein